MKTRSINTIIALALLLTLSTFAQTPQAFKYQTVVRDAAGEILQNQNVSFRFNVHDIDATGTVVYSETHTTTTSEFGLVSLNIGSGVPVSGSFTTIDWGNGSKYLEAELDPAGGSSFVSMGTSQLLSVPYALFSENTANNNDADADPANELQTISIVGNNLSISDGNTVVLPGDGISNKISDNDGDTWIDVERTGNNDSIIFTTFGMERMKISNNGYVQVSGQMIATGFSGDGSGLTGIPGDDLGDHTATSDLDMNDNNIINVDEPQNDSDAATKFYVDSQPGDNLGNHTATDDLDMNGNLITNLVNPISNTDGATKGYVDAKPGDNLGNHTASQNLVLGNNWISNDGNMGGISISSDGFVGINSAMPDQSLVVNGNLRVSDQVMAGFGTSTNASYRFGAGSENSGLSSPLAYCVALITDGVQRMIVTQNGNIGIGTNSPANNLHIQGSFRLANGTQANGRVLTTDANGTASWSEPSSFVQNEWHSTGNSGTVSGTHFIGTTNAQDLDIRTNNIIRARFTQKGQIETLNTGHSVFIGEGAGASDDLTNNLNVFVGYMSGFANTTGYSNTASGNYSLYSNTTGYDNTTHGCNTLFANTTGNSNTANGSYSLEYNTTGSRNTGIGYESLNSNTTGSWNTAIGYQSLNYNNIGSSNTASGYKALNSNTTGNYNNANGREALYSNNTGNSNTANGYQALYNNTAGQYNTALGNVAGNIIISGNYNTCIGYDADLSAIDFTNATAIGNGATADASNQVRLGNSSVTTLYCQGAFTATTSNSPNMYVDANGQIMRSAGTVGSSNWLLTGNSGTVYGTHFIGTTDNVAVNFRVYNQKSGRIGAPADGSVFLGYLAGSNDDLSDNRNTFIGYMAGYTNTTGDNNTAQGSAALSINSSGDNNTANGYQALANSSTGDDNTAIGNEALYSNKCGNKATAIGSGAMFFSNSSSSPFTNNNVAVGFEALRGSIVASDNTGTLNTALGYQSLWNNSTGEENTAAGYQALYNNTTGYFNTAIGSRALYSNTTGIYNTAIGMFSLQNNNDGNYNTAIGIAALWDNTTGDNNTACGYGALGNNTTGNVNTSIGNQSLNSNTTGQYNTALGYDAGFWGTGITTGTYNTFIGYKASSDNAARINCIAIAGNGNLSFSGDNRVRIGNSSMSSIGGQVAWSALSDKRIKENVKENVPGLNFILKLKPVTYTLNLTYENEILGIKDTTGFGEESLIKNSQIVRTGFLAQDVDETAKSIGFDFDGVDRPEDENGLWGLRYAEFVVPLVKGMQEQQKMIDELKAENMELKNEISAIKQMLINK